MKIRAGQRKNLYAKIGTSLVVVFIYIAVSIYIKTTRQAKPASTADTGSDVVEQINSGNQTVSANSNLPVNQPAANNNTVPANNAPTNSNAPAHSNAPTNSNAPANSNTNTQPATAYKNGTYTVNGSYMCPAGLQQIGISVTVANDKIIATEAVNKASSSTPSQYQNDFISSYKSFVIGKSIADLKLGKVARSSLTPNGFNDALSKIKAAAKS